MKRNYSSPMLVPSGDVVRATTGSLQTIDESVGHSFSVGSVGFAL